MGFLDAKLLLRASASPVKIIDVGGMNVGKDDFHEGLVRAGMATVLGFEPVAAECERLNAGSDGTRRYLPHAIGDGGEAIFRECNYPMTSSLYEPNIPLLEKFQALAEVTQVVRRTPVQTKRLDDIPEAAGADYLKLDVQGAELDVLRGADRLLDSLLVVQTEVVFVPLYHDQPLFADIDTVLRRRGFAFHRFLGVCGRAFKPFLRDGSPSKALSQELWSDAVYVRDFMRFDALSPQQLLKLALIVTECFLSVDLAALALRAHDAATGGTLGAEFAAAFSKH